MNTIQDRGRILSTMSFSTNGGDTHVCLDMVKNATIRAKDFRVRCLFEGGVRHLDVAQIGTHTFTVTDRRNALRVTVDFPYAVFGNTPVTYEITRDERMVGIDAVLHHGEEAEINFAQLSEAIIVTVIDVAPVDTQVLGATICEKDEKASLRATHGNLSSLTPTKPDASRALYNGMKLWRDGSEYKPAF
jgi:hypothetical protein